MGRAQRRPGVDLVHHHWVHQQLVQSTGADGSLYTQVQGHLGCDGPGVACTATPAHLQGGYVRRGAQLGALLQRAAHQHKAQQHGGLLKVGLPVQRGHGRRQAADREAGQRAQADQAIHVWRASPGGHPALRQNLPPWACAHSAGWAGWRRVLLTARRPGRMSESHGTGCNWQLSATVRRCRRCEAAQGAQQMPLCSSQAWQVARLREAALTCQGEG